MIEARVSERSMRELDLALRKFEAGMDVSYSRAMRGLTRSVLGSLAKATTVSDKYREFRDTGETSRSGANRKFEVYTNFQTPKRRGKATRASWGDTWRWQTIYAKNVQQLKRRPAVRIGLRGLAAQSWRQMGAKGRIRIKDRSKDTTDKRNARIVKKMARRWVDLSMNLRGIAKYVTLRNDIRYIRDAIGGPATINEALQKGARGLIKSMNKQLDKAWA
jgi:hypothetical protein